ncbi:MAG: prephenate dehydratase [Deltaproteobacteria bacterium]|nr:prephenate dehydratase [Deltaproteobacteria bacterium]MBW2141892.1 prephenate dehydratase [Deltaproteobacteria bacterium]MBW2323895.1 prephenate dehydratase [Deltaproteobacteria bacterium]
MGKNDLTELRRKIDKIDEGIVDLLNQRQALAKEIGQYKNSQGLSLFDPGREEELLARLKKINGGVLSPKALEHIYREIISASLAAQAPISAGYLGPEATFSHEAALQQFGRSARLIAQESLREVFQGVDRGRFAYGVVPVENSSQGGVGETLDLFLEYDLKVCQEIQLRISHNLMGQTEDLKEIKKVYSHPQVLSQCARWLAANLPGVPLLESSSSAAAARQAAKEKGTAAVASKIAAEMNDLQIIIRGIEDAEQNVTRFLVLSSVPGPKSGRDKTSIILAIEDKPGALFHLLEPFNLSNINLTKIESRPMKHEAWKYVFFIDVEGHIDDGPVHRTVESARNWCQWLKVLGSYPRVD